MGPGVVRADVRATCWRRFSPSASVLTTGTAHRSDAAAGGKSLPHNSGGALKRAISAAAAPAGAHWQRHGCGAGRATQCQPDWFRYKFPPGWWISGDGLGTWNSRRRESLASARGTGRAGGLGRRRTSWVALRKSAAFFSRLLPPDHYSSNPTSLHRCRWKYMHWSQIFCD
jgi:hypothetical protein